MKNSGEQFLHQKDPSLHTSPAIEKAKKRLGEKKEKISILFFLFSLLFLTTIFYLVRHFMTNIDELDSITASYLATQGKKFYLDLFNMHFPLPFYVAYFFTPFWVNEDPSRAIAVFRLSLLSVYFVSFLLVFLSFKNKKTKNVFSFWLILLSLLVPLYHGNIYVSETFATIFVASIFWIIAPIAINLEKFSNYHLSLLILFASLAFWTQPLLALLFLLPLFFIKKPQFLRFILYSFILNIIPVIYLILNGQFPAFFRQAIIFNSQTYSHFFPEQIDNYSMFYQNILNFFKNELYLFTHFYNATQIFQFITHFSFFLFLFMVITKKRPSSLLALILIFLETRSREIKIIPGQIYNFAIFPFLSISTATVFLLLAYLKNLKAKIAIVVVLLIIFICTILDFKPIFLQSLSLGYNYEVFWSYRQRIGEDISRLTRPDEKILIYPHNADLYFFAHRQPLDKFLYWYPWIDSVDEFKNERLKALKESPPSLIYYANLAYKDNPKAYEEFFPNILDNYVNVIKDGENTSYWLRVDLKDRLHP